MSDSLNELLERLNWARTEISAVEQDMAAWADDECRLYAQDGLRPGFMALMYEVKSPISIKVRARAGTTTNEIRTCLDGLASFLAAKKGYRDAHFPVADDENAFTTDKRLRTRLGKFTETDQETLMGFRPFAIGKDGLPGNLLLYGLHHADVRRKHHRLLAKSAATSLGFIQGSIGELAATPGPIKVPGTTQVCWLSNNSNVQLRFEPIAFYSEPNVLRGRPLIETLHNFADVSETIIRAFL